MRALTRNEKVLLALFFAILFGGANFYGYQWFARKQASLKLNYVQLREDQADGEVDLQKKDLWEKRKAWLKEHEPVLGNEGTAKADVLQFVLKGARDHQLEIMEQNLNDSQPSPGGERINVSVKVKGSMQNLCGWLTELEKPDSFYAVALFSLKADQDQKSMVCNLQVARYFKGNP